MIGKDRAQPPKKYLRVDHHGCKLNQASVGAEGEGHVRRTDDAARSLEVLERIQEDGHEDELEDAGHARRSAQIERERLRQLELRDQFR